MRLILSHFDLTGCQSHDRSSPFFSFFQYITLDNTCENSYGTYVCLSPHAEALEEVSTLS
jgi:hypothetical protein